MGGVKTKIETFEPSPSISTQLNVVKSNGDFPDNVVFISGITMCSNQSKIMDQLIVQEIIR